MRTRLTLVLLGANLALFGFIFFLQYQDEREAGIDRTRRVFGSEASNIDYLEIRLPHEEEARVLRREGDKWNIKAPIQWPANFFAVNRILQQIEFLEKETSFRTSDLKRTGQSLDHYGLETPRAEFIFGRGSQRYSVHIGEATDIGNRLYILDPSKEWIHVVNRELAESLSLQLSDLRSETVFHIPLFEVRSLNVQLGSHSKVRLARKDGDWIFETPFQTRADKKSVEAVINRLNSLQIRSFENADAEGADFGLSNPTMRITLDGNSRRETLLIGRPIPGRPQSVYAKLADNPTVFAVAADPLQAVERAQDLLRDRKLIHLDRAKVTSLNLALQGGATEVLLQKLETNQWQIVTRNPDQSVRILPADTALVERLIAAMDEAYVLRFENDAPSAADLARYGFSDPQRVVTISGDDSGDLILGAHVPDSNGSEIYARLSTSRFVYTVDGSLLREMPVNTQYFRDRLLQRQPEGAIISSIRLRNTRTGEVTYESSLAAPESTWQQAVAEMPEKERTSILALLPELRNLRVQRYLQDHFSPTFEMDGKEIEFAYELEADLLLVGGDTPRRSQLRLLLSDRLGGQTVIGGSPELDVIFTVRQTLIDALTPLLFERPRPESEEGVSLSANG
jgi:hypothetical protein